LKIDWKRVSWVGPVARRGRRGDKHTFSWKEIENFKELDVDSRMILKWMLSGMGLCDWIHLTAGGDKWRALVNTTVILRGFHKMRRMS
jgi:hypothetical protein